jgi:hypothetical protein
MGGAERLRTISLSLATAYITQVCARSTKPTAATTSLLLHHGLGASNVLVDEKSCHLTSVIDWAEAETCPLGQNLHFLEAFTGMMHL